jgi:hypothetical protein
VETALYVDTVNCCGDEYHVQGMCESVMVPGLAVGQVVFVTMPGSDNSIAGGLT